MNIPCFQGNIFTLTEHNSNIFWLSLNIGNFSAYSISHSFLGLVRFNIINRTMRTSVQVSEACPIHPCLFSGALPHRSHPSWSLSIPVSVSSVCWVRIPPMASCSKTDNRKEPGHSPGTLPLSPSLREQSPAAYYLRSKNCCFIPFIQCSSCLWQECN